MAVSIDSIGGEDYTHCPICRRQYSRDDYILKNSPDNTDYESDCHHWFCNDCFQEMYETRNTDCPICNVDLSEFLEIYYGESDKEEESEEGSESE